MKNNIKFITLSILVCILVIAGGFAMNCNIWNDGVCKKCSGNYEFVGSNIEHFTANKHVSTRYLYECDNCGKKIRLNNFF